MMGVTAGYPKFDAGLGRVMNLERRPAASTYAYRLEWQAMGSLERRLRACYCGVRR